MNFQIDLNEKPLKVLFLNRFLSLLMISVFCLTTRLQAQTWASSPATGDWNTAGNWTSPSAVPNSQSALAVFNTSGTTSLSLSSGVSVSAIQFNIGASAFTINTSSNELAFFGTGIANNSSSAQNFAVGSNGLMDFYSTSTASNATLTNGGSVTFHNNSTAGTAAITNNFGGEIYFCDNSSFGTASITNNGFAQFQNNSTAGNATMINNSTLNFFDGSTAGNSTITNNQNLFFQGLGSGITATAGNSTITNTSEIGFFNYSSCGNAAITNNDILKFMGNSTAGNAVITSGGAVSFYNTSTAGGATITNTGTLSFNDNSTAGSATITNNNSMSFNNNSSAATVTINNTSNGSINFNDDSTAGNSSIANNGNLTFNGQGNGVSFSTAGSAAITNNAAMAFDDYSTAGNANIASNYILDFNNNSTAAFANIVNSNTVDFQNFSTAGNANITNNASLSFSDNSTAGNAVIVNNSAMVFLGNSTAGNATITTNSGDVFFETTASGGTARLILSGSGYLDISGETTGVPVTIGSLEGSGSVSLGGNNLTAGANNLSSSYSGVITDNGYFGGTGGSLNKIGGGTLTLSGNNLYTGGTDIKGGVLAAANSNALGTGLVNVNGGTLSLSGPLTLNIGNSYSQASSGTLQLGLGGTNSGQWDVLNITASSTLAGTLKLVSYSGFQTHSGETFELLDSTGGLSGRFGTVTDLLLEPVSILYTPNEAILETLTFSQFALTPNQTAVAGALDNLTALSADPTLLDALDNLPTLSLSSVYDQISPSNLTPLFKMGFMAAQAQGGLVWQRLFQYWGSGNSNSPYAALEGESPMFASTMSTAQEAQIAQNPSSDRWGAFASGIGNFGTITSDGNGAGYQFSTGGTTAGLDYRFSKDFVGGLLLGYDQSGTSQSTGTVNATSGQLGLYMGLKANQFHVEALVDGGLDSYTTQRTSFGGMATGNTSGMEYTGELNMGFDFKMDSFKISPFVSGQYTQIDVNGFSETGSLAPLTYGNQGEGYLSSDLGSQFSLDLKMGGFRLLPNISGAWEHVYQGNVDSLTASFGTGNSFTVDGSATGTDAAVVGGGLSAEFSRDFNVYAEYQGKMGMTNYTSQSFTGGINLFFGGSAEKTYGNQTSKPIAATATPILVPSAMVTPIATLPNLVLPVATQGTVPANISKVQTTASPVATPSAVVSPVITATPVMTSHATPIVIPGASPVIITHSW